MPEWAKVLKLPEPTSAGVALSPSAQASPAPVDRLSRLNDQQRQRVMLRQQLVTRVLAEREGGVSIRVAARNLIAAIETGQASEATIGAAKRLAKGGKATPSHQALERWVSAYCRHGLDGLIPKHKGSERQAYGWEARALSLYQRPVKAAMSTVAWWLQQEGFDTATISRVRRYLKSLPTQLSSHAPKRVGPHYYRQNLTPYVVRDTSALPVGFVYEGDGHCCDVHIAHPQTGKATRPELTVWLDVRSHYCVGWWLSDAERASDTLFSLSHAIVSHDHVPAMIHVDPGSGYKNKLIQGEAVSYCERLSIEFMSALPGNARGKGLVEGFFHIFEERCGKQFDTYCGHVRTDHALSDLRGKVKRGEMVLPTQAQYVDAITAFMNSYNHSVQRGLGCTPAELWQQLERTPLEVPAAAIVRPQAVRVVRRQQVEHDRRRYGHPALAGFEGQKIAVEYDLHNDARATLRTLAGQFICEAEQVEAKPWLPTSRIEEQRLKRLKGQIARKESAIAEDKARAGLTLTHEQDLIHLNELPILNEPVPLTRSPIDLHVFDDEQE